MNEAFFDGIFYFIQTLGLALLYLAAFAVLFLVLRWLKRKVKDRKTGEPIFMSKKEGKVALFLLSAFVFFNVFLYARLHSKWMGKDTAYPDAKEYFVAGQVVNAYRFFWFNLGAPDKFYVKPFVEPFNALQQKIYDQGVKYLPKEDGEIGIWTDLWFVYPWSKRFRIPKAKNPWITTPARLALIKRAWFCVRTVATKPFADRQMYEEYYLRDFPGMAFYYSMYEEFYAGNRFGAARKLAQDPMHVARSKQLVAWCEELQRKWQASRYMRTFLKRHQEVEAILQVEMLEELEDVIDGEIWERQFKCDDPFILKYVEVRNEFVEGKGGMPFYRRIGSRVMSKELYDRVINAMQSRFTRRILNKYCGYEAAGKENLFFYRSLMKTPEELIWERINSGFREELNLLKEQNHE